MSAGLALLRIAFNAGGKDGEGNEQEPCELGYLGIRRSTISTRFVMSDSNTCGGAASSRVQGPTKGQWGIRKTSTTTVDFEELALAK